MRYGICTGIENAGLVKKLGYDYIELSVTKTMGLDPAAYAAGKKALEESGIEAECFNILFPKTMNFVDGKTTSFDELEIYLEKAMAMIADLHGKAAEGRDQADRERNRKAGGQEVCRRGEGRRSC